MMRLIYQCLLGAIVSIGGVLAEDSKALDAIEESSVQAVLTPAHANALKFTQPVWYSPMVGKPGVAIVLEHRTAQAWLLHRTPDSDVAQRRTLFADWKAEVSDGPWEGLMAVAFHPDYPSNRRFFVKHETIDDDGQRFTHLVEKRASENLMTDSGEINRTLLKIKQPADNHNGGTVAFGPDGYLYVAMGDGGPQEDPNGYTQSGASFLGKMLRLDVDTSPAEGAGLPYSIPKDNPFTDRDPGDWHHEIWALGFREPWRFTFDQKTGDLWLGDVGQVRYEEIAIVRRGENHGWNVIEGFENFSDKRRREDEVYVPPVVVYGRALGNSVTGGYVYRGKKNPDLNGAYIFGDFTLKHIWALRQKDGKLEVIRKIATAPEAISSFGQDESGELYVVGYGGIIYALDVSAVAF